MEPETNPQNQPTPTEASSQAKPIVRTYQSDLAQALKEKKGSIVSIAAAEEKRRQKHDIVFEPDAEAARKKKWFLFSAIALAIVGIIGLGFLFFGKQKVTPIEKTPFVVPSVIFVNMQKEMSIDEETRDMFVSKIAKEIKAANIRLDFIEHIFFTKKQADVKTLVSVRDFFALSSEHIQPSLLRSFEGDYVLGIHAFNGNIPFFIVRLNSFENAFSGMLKWETFMADDILPIFGKEEMLKTLTQSEHFEDYLFINQDTRVLRNRSGGIALLYAFPDRNTLVITTSEDTFKEIINRLKTPKPSVQ